MKIPPGVLFCLVILKLLSPPIVLHVSLRLLSYVYSWSFSTSAFVAVWVFTLPVYVQARSAYTHYVHIREARKLGAELVPSIRGKWPGNLDILYSGGFVRKNSYIGDGLVQHVQTHGTTFALSTLGETRILTMNPENIKRILATDFDNYVKGKSFNT
jgi:hypothetical protein